MWSERKRGARTPPWGTPMFNCHTEGDEPGTGMKNGKPGHRSQLYKMQGGRVSVNAAERPRVMKTRKVPLDLMSLAEATSGLGFSASALWMFGLDDSVLWGCPVPCRVCSGSPG